MEEQDIRAQRLAKLERLRAAGRDPYLIERYDRSHSAAEILEAFPNLEEAEFSPDLLANYRFPPVEVRDAPPDAPLRLAPGARIAGRLVSKRDMGRLHSATSRMGPARFRSTSGGMK